MSKSIDQLKNDVNQKITELRTKFPTTIPFPVTYELDSKRTVGQMRYSKNPKLDYRVSMNLNPTLLLEFGEAYINEVVVHEFAHIVVESFYKNYTTPRGKVLNSHGKEWKRVMERFGVYKPTAKTSLFNESLSLKKNPRKKTNYIYTCDCDGREHKISIRRHNNIIKKGNGYICKICSAPLVFSGREEITYE